MTVIRLTVVALLPMLAAAVLYLLEKRTPFGKLRFWPRQLAIGLVFGGLAVISTEFGIEIDGAIINVRDAAPLCAGLIFGGPAGIIAGVIGGVERWFSVLWSGGEYTQLACSLATVLAGFVGAGIRRFMFDGKKPSWGYGLAVGLTMEVVHMLLIFITHMSDVNYAFTFVAKCAPVMIPLNGIAVMLAVLLVSCLGKEKLHRPSEKKKIVQTFSIFLTVCVVAAFLVKSLFTYVLETRIAESNAEALLELNISDVRMKLAGMKTKEDVTAAARNYHIGKKGSLIICDSRGVIVSNQEWNEGLNIKQAIETDGTFDLADTENEGKMFRGKLYGTTSCCMYDKAGEYYIVATLPESEAMFTRDISVYITMFMEMVVYAALFTHIYFLIKKLVVQNIHEINKSLARITSGDLDVTVNVCANEEFASLSNDINSTVTTLKHYISEAEARIDRELEFARQIQYSALPSVFPPYPNRADFDIYALMETAKEVGGDFYDFYLLDQNTLVFLIADVSGKGIPAAMFMMTAKTLIKSLVESGMGIGAAFTQANSKLCENNETGMFVTAWIGALNLTTGRLFYANAGHNPPLIRRKNQKFEYLKSRANFVLAGMEGVKYREHELQLQPGDEIFLYTDGVTEATDADGQLYGEERLRKAIAASDQNGTAARCAGIKADIDLFVGDAPQFDDITMLSVRFNCLQTEDSIITEPDLESLSVVSAFLSRKMAGWNISAKTANKVQIAADEIYSNIMRYSGAARAEVVFRKEDGGLLLIFEDDGKPYDPTSAREPDVSLAAADREIGGLGIFMVKKLAASMKYEYADGRNVLTLTFRL